MIFNERGSKGFGFVTVKYGWQAEYAINMLEGKLIGDRIIEVNHALPKGKAKSATIRRTPYAVAPALLPIPPNAKLQKDSVYRHYVARARN